MKETNVRIGTAIGTTLGFAVQGVIYARVADVISAPRAPSALLVRCGVKYGVKLVKFTCKNYVRTDFSSETIFSDAIDASFSAD